MHLRHIIILAFASLPIYASLAESAPKPEDYYKVVPIPVPEGIVLEAGGLDFMPDWIRLALTFGHHAVFAHTAAEEVSGNRCRTRL